MLLWKLNSSAWHVRGTKKNLSPRQELNPWPPEHRAVGLSTELRELMERNVILVFGRPWPGSIPIGTQIFPLSHARAFSLLSSKFTIFIKLSRMIRTMQCHHVYCSCRQSCCNIALCTPAWVLSLLYAPYKCTRRSLSLLCIPVTCPLVCVDLYGVFLHVCGSSHEIVCSITYLTLQPALFLFAFWLCLKHSASS